VHFQVVGTQAHAFGAQERHGAQVGFVQVVFTNRGTLGFVDLILAERHFHVQNVSRAEQAVGMLFQAENRRAVRGVVRTHAFKTAEAVMQGVGEDVGLGITPGNHFSVQPDNAIAVSHRHSVLLLKKRFSGNRHSSRILCRN